LPPLGFLNEMPNCQDQIPGVVSNAGGVPLLV
jgi:hypothetical protein